MPRMPIILVFGLLCFSLHPVFGQDQRVADSLAKIYREDNLVGEDKMNLLKELAFNEMNDRELSLKYAEELIRLAEIENNARYLFSGYNSKGEYYKKTGALDMALEIFFMAVNVAIDSKRINDEAIGYISIADVYAAMENYVNAEQFYNKSIVILRSSADSIPLASALLNAGDTYYIMERYEDALRCFEEAGPIFRKLDYSIGSAYNLGNMGMIYAKQGKDSLAKNNINEAISILEESGDYYPISVYLTIMSDIYLKQNDFATALGYTKRSLELATASSLKEQIAAANLQLSELYEQAGNPEEALKYYKNHILYRDSVRNLEAIEQMADVRTDFEVAQKQIEVDLLTQKRKNQQVINILAAVASVLIILLAIGIYRRYVFTKNTNVKIRTQRDEIESQRDLLEAQRDLVVLQKDEIIESINYARRIQSAMLPPETYFSELFKEHFILYKPRDIVSGDFYWIKKVKHYVVLVVADCTGHGVPGAFMSMLGMSNLNEIVHRREITQANQVLNELRTQIKYSLRQQGKRDDSKDGIDMAVGVMDLKSMEMQYAGANIPLYVIKDVIGTPKLMEIKPDQKVILEKTLSDWMGDHAQIDDLLVIGVRV